MKRQIKEQIKRMFKNIKKFFFTKKSLSQGEDIINKKENIDAKIVNSSDIAIEQIQDSRKISEILMSVRLRNVCLDNKIETFSQFLELSNDEWKSFKNFGRKTLFEVIDLREIISDKLKNEVDEVEENKKDITMKNQIISNFILDEKFRKSDFSTRTINIFNSLNINNIRKLLMKTELDFKQLHNCGKKTIIEINNYLSKKNIEWNGDYEEVFDTPKENEIKIDSFFIEIYDYLNDKSQVHKDIFFKRIAAPQKATLEDLGQIYNITRERVRQIENKIKKDIIYIFGRYENYFIKNFSEYGGIIAFSKQSAFNEINNYIDILVSIDDLDEVPFRIDKKNGLLISKNVDMSEFEIDYNDDYSQDDVTETIHVILDKYLKRDEFENKNNFDCVFKVMQNRLVFKETALVDGFILKPKKSNILAFFLKKYCLVMDHIDHISQKYKDFLIKNNLDIEKFYSATDRAFRHSIISRNDMLLSPGKKLRFYNFDTFNKNDFINSLDLDNYQNLEISTKKIFDDNMDIMEDYNIHNEYELHNLLKKIIERDDISFPRTPIINIGNCDRKKQIIDLYKSLYPISIREFTSVYAEEYGLSKGNVGANYIPILKSYIDNNHQHIVEVKISDEECNKLKRTLTKDFYFLKELKDLFLTQLPYLSENYFNKLNVGLLGYSLSSVGALSNKYSSLSEYFKDFLDAAYIFDFNNYVDFKKNQLFLKYFYEKRNALDLIEFSSNMYISAKKLEEKGIDKHIIYNFVDNINIVTGDDFFTIFSVKDSISDEKLMNLGFKDIFYIDILKKSENFKYFKINNVVVFKRNETPIDFEDFLLDIMGRFRNINIYDMIDYIKKEHNLLLTKYEIISITKNSELYYNDIMEKVYIDYDDFLNDI